MSWSRNLKAKWTLGTALMRKLALRPFSGSTGAEAWLQRLAMEQIGVTPDGATERASNASRCLGCGLCDWVGVNGGRLPPSLLIGYSRRGQDAPIVLSAAEQLRFASEVIGRVCPAGVDADGVAELIRSHSRVLLGKDK